MKESSLLKKFLIEYSSQGHRLFRFQSGLFWGGKATRITEKTTVTLNPGDVYIRRARPIKSGQMGISDLIGFTRVTITPDMVGRTMAIFTSCEVKTGKLRATKQQANYIRMVNQNGGIAVIARKLEDIFEAINKFMEGNHDTRH